MLRLLHTADWHLGHTLRDQSRTGEHAAFLSWLLEQLVAAEIDALVIAGDVFDTANPPAAALSMFYRFLADARALRPGLDVVVIAGNHDSGARLDAPQPLLDGLDIQVVGALPRTADGALDPGALAIPLHDAAGEVAAWAVAVPYLRPSDLGRRARTGDPLVEGVRAVYADALEHARGLRDDEAQALLCIGHCYMADARTSEDSERKILGGHLHGLPVDVFPPDVGYVALGHLHLAQAVDGAGRVRYSGSPLPLSLAEEGYAHQVLLVRFDGPTLAEVEALPIPRAVEMVRLPEGPLEEVLERLRALPPLVPGTPVWKRPFLEVTVRLDGPEPLLRPHIEAALDDRAPRLVRLNVLHDGDGDPLAERHVAHLADLSPEEVFRRRWKRDHEGEPPGELMAAYHELVQAASE